MTNEEKLAVFAKLRTENYKASLRLEGMDMKTKVYIIESERGWGQKVDEVKEFDSLKEAEKFIAEYNASNNLDSVPDWYMYATL